MMDPCLKGCVLRNSLIFELSSLQNVIGILFKMLRTLFGKGTLFSIIVTNPTKVVLWNSFELFDQLHLLQLLDCFAYKQEVSQRLNIIFIDEYLWRATSESRLERLGKREPVSEKQLVLGQLSWTAFAAPTPELMLELMRECTSVLPFLQNALFRLFEEFPAEWSGLPRTEHCFLEQVKRWNLLARQFVFCSSSRGTGPFYGGLVFLETRAQARRISSAFIGIGG